jgi:hypothetical protein
MRLPFLVAFQRFARAISEMERLAEGKGAKSLEKYEDNWDILR